MKRLAMITLGLFMTSLAMSQAVSDRNVVPLAVNLNQVLRMTIIDGGNIEFTFNSIDQYKTGINSGAAGAANYYNTEFTVSSSTAWELSYGSEDANLVGVDDPANTLALDNVGFHLENNGTHTFGAGLELDAQATVDGGNNGVTNADINALQAYPMVLITDQGTAGARNAGDATDNSFVMVWRCGTTEAQGDAVTPMSTVALIDQTPSPDPDRYVTNVLFDLAPLP